MSVNTVNSDGSLLRVAGGTLYADAPIGTISPFGGSSVPSGYLLCNGQAVNRTTYAELFAVIGTAFGTGDGSTTFNVPDMRESVPKGAGLTGKTVGAHLDADGLAVGEFLDDRIQNITGEIARSGAIGAGGAFYGSGANYNANLSPGSIDGSKHDTYFDASRIVRAGNTTEVKSVGVNYIIKAKQVAVPADFMDAVDEAMASVEFATLSSKNESVTLGDYICSKNVRNVCAMVKGRTSNTVPAATKMYSGFFNPLTPNVYPYLDIPFAIRNRTTNVTEMRMGYLDANGNFYTSAYTEAIESDWDIQLFFNYQTE